MSQLLKIQYVTQINIDKMYKKYKKSPREHLSKLSYVNTRLETLEERVLNTFSNTKRKIYGRYYVRLP